MLYVRPSLFGGNLPQNLEGGCCTERLYRVLKLIALAGVFAPSLLCVVCNRVPTKRETKGIGGKELMDR